MSVKITALQAENVKRIKAVQIEPAPNGLTIVGGNNNQGKTSVLDAIAWALGGEKYRPNAAAREGARQPAPSAGYAVQRYRGGAQGQERQPDRHRPHRQARRADAAE